MEKKRTRDEPSTSDHAGRETDTQQRPHSDFGAFEKSTKGFGMKMLLKMGYKPGAGLGKEGEGRVNPIEVKLRQGQAGLGFGELPPRRGAEAGGGAVAAAAARVSVREPSWRRSVQRGKGAEADIKVSRSSTPSGDAATTLPAKIIDYTSSVPRELSSLAERGSITQRTDFQDTAIHQPRFPELRHNLDLLLRRAETEQRHARQALQQQRQAMGQLEEEQRAVASKLAVLERRQAVVTEIRAIVAASSEPRDDPSLLGTLSALAAYAKDCRHEDAIRLLAARSLASLSLSALRQRLALVAPRLTEPTLLELVSRLAPISYFRLEDLAAPDLNYATPYEEALSAALLPRLRSAIVTDLSAPGDEGALAAAELLTAWINLLPTPLLREILTVTVLPALRRTLEGNATDQLHLHLLPWLRILQQRSASHGALMGAAENVELADGVAELFQGVRRRLAVWIQQRDDPLSQSCLSLLETWRPPALPQREFDTLLARLIIPAITASLSLLEIEPASQDIGPITTALSWAAVVPAEILAGAFSKHLFPKLESVLKAWMSDPTADFAEITEWYDAWKGLFPPHLSEQPAMQEGWDGLLRVMNSLLLAATTTSSH